jgi:multiple sugar transport system substrate-binding protein
MIARQRPPWLCVLVALTLAACGGGASPGPTGGPSAAPPSAQATSPSPPSPSAGLSGELAFWVMGDDKKGKALAQAFTAKNPGVKITVTGIDWGAGLNKLLTAIAARQTPDVGQIGTTWMAQLAQTGGFERIPADIDSSRFFQGAFNTAVVNGTPYGVPWYVETRMLFYRTDLAEKAGFTHPPATWDDLKAMAVALKKAGVKWPILLQPGGGGSWQQWFPFVWSNGADVMSPDGKWTLDTPAALEALTFYQSFFKEGLAPATEQVDLVPEWKAGRVGMFFSGPWFISIFNDQAPELKGKWNVAPMPKKVSGTSFVGGSDLVVFADSKNKDLAWTFVRFLSDPAVQVQAYQISGELPAVKDAWQDPVMKSDPLVAAFGQQLEDAKSPPAVPKWEEVAAVIDSEIEQVTKAGKDPQAALREMQSQADSIGTGL